jgi:hypothetical protein
LGVAFGLDAKSKNDSALQPANCRTSTYCTPVGLNLTKEAKDSATLSTIAFGAGAAVLATGVVLWLTAPSSAQTGGIRLAPVVAKSYTGLAVDAAW